MEEIQATGPTTEHRDVKAIQENTSCPPPIRRIPNEVLSSIFLHLVGETNPYRWEEDPLGLPRDLVVAASHVCRHWRDLALRTPLLWSKISVTIDTFGNIETLRRRVPIWISRSSPGPIDLRLRLFGEVDQTEEDVFAPVSDAISLASPRLREIDCQLHFQSENRSQSLVDFFTQGAETFKNLEKVVVSNKRMPFSRRPAADIILPIASGSLFAAPSLRCFQIDGDWDDISAVMIRSALPLYDSLEELTFNAEVVGQRGFLTEEWVLKIFKSLPRLVTFEMKLSFRGRLHTGKEVVKMSRLTSLTLHSVGFSPGFAASLDLPSLQSLSLISDSVTALWRAPAQGDKGSTELLLKFGQQLKVLSFDIESVAKHGLTEVLAELQSVEKLRLYYSFRPHKATFHRDLATLLEMSAPGVLPKLQELRMGTIVNKQDDSAIELALVDFIAGRRKAASSPEEGVDPGSRSTTPTAQILKVDLDFSGERQVDIPAKLESRSVGLDGLCMNFEYEHR